MVERDANGRLKPGSVLNPRGARTRTDISVAAAMRSMAGDLSEDGVTRNAEALARTAWRQAIAGNAVWGKLVLDYTDGPPVQKIAPTTPDGEREFGSDIRAALLRKLAGLVAESGEGDVCAEPDQA